MRIKLATIAVAFLLLGGCGLSQPYPTIITPSTTTTTMADFDFELDLLLGSTTSTTQTTGIDETEGGVTGGIITKTSTTATTADSQKTTTAATTTGLPPSIDGNYAETVRYTGRFSKASDLTDNCIATVLPSHIDDIFPYLLNSDDGAFRFGLTEAQANVFAEAVFGRKIAVQTVNTTSWSYRIYWDAAQQKLVYELLDSRKHDEQYATQDSRAVSGGYEITVWCYEIVSEQPSGTEGVDWVKDGKQFRHIKDRYTVCIDQNGKLLAVK